MIADSQSPWTLLQPPRWRAALSLFGVFAILLFMGGASLTSPWQVSVSFLTALGYYFLFDAVRMLVVRMSQPRWVGVITVVALLALDVWLLYEFFEWQRAESIPRYIIFPVRFAVTLAICTGCARARFCPKLAEQSVLKADPA